MMNEILYRSPFNQMKAPEKLMLMKELAARYNMTFTGVFGKNGREFVFIPGDTVTLGWERFAVGLNQESREELEYLFREWEWSVTRKN